MIKVKFSVHLDTKGLMARLDKKTAKVLSRTGAYARGVIKKSIRPPKSERRAKKIAGGMSARLVTVGGREYVVAVRGRVLDSQTGRVCTKEQANAARLALRSTLRSEGAGLPPRRGPKDLLRRFILFVVDSQNETVTVGPKVFGKQPPLVGALDVPQLLEFGGGEYIAGMLVQYEPRPFVKPALDTAYEKMAQLTEQIPL